MPCQNWTGFYLIWAIALAVCTVLILKPMTERDCLGLGYLKSATAATPLQAVKVSQEPPPTASTASSNSLVPSAWMHWDAIIVGTIGGVAAGLVLSAFSVARNFTRDWLLERKIRRGLKKGGIGHGLLGLTATVKNESGVNIRIRGVQMLTTKAAFVFNPVAEESKKPSIHEYRQPGFVPPAAQTADFPTAAPFTGFAFLLPAAFIAVDPGEALYLEITIDYDTYGGRRRVMVEKSEDQYNLLKGTLNHYRASFENGELNKGRKMFGLTEIRKP